MSDSRFQVLLEATDAVSRQTRAQRDESLPRLWRGFMAARILIALVLVITLLFLRLMGSSPNAWAMLISLSYLAITVWVRVLGKPFSQQTWSQTQGQGKRRTSQFDPQWLATVGADLLVFGALLYLQVGGVNFTALFVLPVLLAAVLGSLLLALGTAAIATITLLAEALQFSFIGALDAGPRYLQAALTGTGLFAMAYLAHQLAARLIRQERVAANHEIAVRTQMHVNQLVIEAMTDGVLVIDAHGVVHAANPAARDILELPPAPAQPAMKITSPFLLSGQAAWQTLAQLALQVLETRQSQTQDIALAGKQGAVRQLHVKAQPVSHALDQMSAGGDTSSPLLCVMLLQDLREIQARVRTEKLAAMGRMSAAVAHEIRNPLSAITQANSLLAEELMQAQQRSLVQMIAHNAQRLARVVDDVLDVSRVESGVQSQAVLHHLSALLRAICQEWQTQHQMLQQLQLTIAVEPYAVRFEAEHLRRIVVNLLDNAKRHASGAEGCIQLRLESSVEEPGQLRMSIWSDGAPLEHSVERHLFEPFFSSQSRSSGLGLYICRELCQRHEAVIGYIRSSRRMGMNPASGNEFFILIRLNFEATQPMQAASTKATTKIRT